MKGSKSDNAQIASPPYLPCICYLFAFYLLSIYYLFTILFAIPIYYPQPYIKKTKGFANLNVRVESYSLV